MIVKGKYEFKIKNKTILTGENLITILGESFFMNRWVNDTFEPIQEIVLGKGTSRPTKSDTNLGKPTLNKNCSSKIDLKNRRVLLSCDVTAAQILGITEIGVTNGDILLSHDIFEPITAEMIAEDLTSTVHIEYSFNINTGGVRRGWKPSTLKPGTFYIYEPSIVVGIIESNTGNGYRKIEEDTELVEGSYYYDFTSKNLYIKPIQNNLDINERDIIVLSR